MQVEIAIPVLNEERTLKTNVESVLAALKNLFERKAATAIFWRAAVAKSLRAE